MDKKEAKAILKRYLEGDCTEEEKALLESWYLKYQHKNLAQVSAQEAEGRLKKIRQALPVSVIPVHKKLIRWQTVAAACFIAATIGIYFYIDKQAGLDLENVIAGKNKILPGGNRAVLTMANGKTINLNEDKNGIVILNNDLVYDDGSKVGDTNEASDFETQLVTLSTPNGGQYQIMLADGTKVWLNSASSLKYPGKFAGNERRVEITGEAYFEVAKLEHKTPFIVESKGQLIEVLGTHFNVMAYPDEKLSSTTLLEGKVKVTNRQATDTRETILRPGQQLQLSETESNVINNPDLEEITAWKDGYFKFSESLESIMVKVARWYDVEVIYQDNFNGKLRFLGKISRSKDLSSILDIIESASNIHFKVEGRRITVMK